MLNPPTKSPSSFNVLVVDDHWETRCLIERYLQTAGYRVGLAENGAKALELLSQVSYDLVLTDLTMPDMNGYEFCLALKSNPILCEIPIVMLTAESDVQTLQHAFDCGAVEFIRKPFHKVELLSRIGNVLKNVEDHRCLKDLYGSLKEDLTLAGNIQSFFLPQKKKLTRQYCIDSLYHPYLSIGGDVFDYQEISQNEIIFYIGDISGHGIQSALLMTAAKTALNNIIQNFKNAPMEPWQAVSILQETMSPYFENHYMTLLFGHLNLKTGRLSYFNAGHPPPCIVSPSQTRFLTEGGGMPVGIDLFQSYSQLGQVEINLGAEDCLLLYTDGIFDVQKSDQVMGYETFKDFILEQQLSQIPFGEVCNKIAAGLDHKGYTKKTDDYTLLTIKRNKPKVERKFRFLSRLEEVEIQAMQLERCLQENNIANDTATQLQLAFMEYVNNIVIHSYRNRSNKLIEADLWISAEFIELEIRDQGEAWKPKIKLLEDIPLEMTSGRGLALIDALIEDFTIERQFSQNQAIMRMVR